MVVMCLRNAIRLAEAELLVHVANWRHSKWPESLPGLQCAWEENAITWSWCWSWSQIWLKETIPGWRSRALAQSTLFFFRWCVCFPISILTIFFVVPLLRYWPQQRRRDVLQSMGEPMTVRREMGFKSRRGRVIWRVKCRERSFWQRRSPSTVARNGNVVFAPRRTFEHGRIVAGVRRVFRQCCKVNTCKQCRRRVVAASLRIFECQAIAEGRRIHWFSLISFRICCWTEWNVAPRLQGKRAETKRLLTGNTKNARVVAESAEFQRQKLHCQKNQARLAREMNSSELKRKRRRQKWFGVDGWGGAGLGYQRIACRQEMEEEAAMHLSHKGAAWIRLCRKTFSHEGLARQQLPLLRTEFGKTYGTNHQPAPITSVHVPKRNSNRRSGRRKRWGAEEVSETRILNRQYQGSQWRVPCWLCLWLFCASKEWRWRRRRRWGWFGQDTEFREGRT